MYWIYCIQSLHIGDLKHIARKKTLLDLTFSGSIYVQQQFEDIWRKFHSTLSSRIMWAESQMETQLNWTPCMANKTILGITCKLFEVHNLLHTCVWYIANYCNTACCKLAFRCAKTIISGSFSYRETMALRHLCQHFPCGPVYGILTQQLRQIFCQTGHTQNMGP